MNYDYCNGRIHTIQTGDTLYKISGMYHVPLALILRANPYVDIYNLQVGEKLCIPGGFDNETKPPRPECGTGGCRPIEPSNPSTPGTPSMPSMPNRPGRPGNTTMSGFIFVIKDVESLQDILDKFDIDLEDLLEENDLSHIMIQPGTSMKIPGYAKRIEESMEREDS